MIVFRTGLSYMFKCLSFGLIIILVLSFILELTNGEPIIANKWYWYLIPTAIAFYIIGRFSEPSIEVNEEGNAIPKRQ